jgi:hypothetical protein
MFLIELPPETIAKLLVWVGKTHLIFFASTNKKLYKLAKEAHYEQERIKRACAPTITHAPCDGLGDNKAVTEFGEEDFYVKENSIAKRGDRYYVITDNWVRLLTAPIYATYWEHHTFTTGGKMYVVDDVITEVNLEDLKMKHVGELTYEYTDRIPNHNVVCCNNKIYGFGIDGMTILRAKLMRDHGDIPHELFFSTDYLHVGKTSMGVFLFYFRSSTMELRTVARYSTSQDTFSRVFVTGDPPKHSEDTLEEVVPFGKQLAFIPTSDHLHFGIHLFVTTRIGNVRHCHWTKIEIPQEYIDFEGVKCMWLGLHKISLIMKDTKTIDIESL